MNTQATCHTTAHAGEPGTDGMEMVGRKINPATTNETPRWMIAIREIGVVIIGLQISEFTHSGV